MRKRGAGNVRSSMWMRRSGERGLSGLRRVDRARRNEVRRCEFVAEVGRGCIVQQNG